jgi:hypothetical protein
MEAQMFRVLNVAITAVTSPAACFQRCRSAALTTFWSVALCCAPPQSHAAGLDCPELGGKAIPALFADLQIKLAASNSNVDLANEVSDAVNKLQILQPNISYTELTNIAIAAYCRVVATTEGLTASEKWARMRQFDTILQQQLAANMEPSGTLIIANVPLPRAVYRELQSQAGKAGQKPAQFLATIPTRAAGN